MINASAMRRAIQQQKFIFIYNNGANSFQSELLAKQALHLMADEIYCNQRLNCKKIIATENASTCDMMMQQKRLSIKCSVMMTLNGI